MSLLSTTPGTGNRPAIVRVTGRQVEHDAATAAADGAGAGWLSAVAIRRRRRANGQRHAITHHALQQIPGGLLELGAVTVQVADLPANARRLGLIGDRQLGQGAPAAEVQAGQELAEVGGERVHPTTTNRHRPRAARVCCWCL